METRRGRDDRRETRSGAAAARPAPRSISLDSARSSRITRENVVNPAVQEAKQVVIETRGMVDSLVNRLGTIEKVLGIQGEVRPSEETPDREEGTSLLWLP